MHISKTQVTLGTVISQTRAQSGGLSKMKEGGPWKGDHLQTYRIHVWYIYLHLP